MTGKISYTLFIIYVSYDLLHYMALLGSHWAFIQIRHGKQEYKTGKDVML